MMGQRLDDWLSRRGVIATIRVVHGAFFVAVAAYCFLSYSPFAYEQFIKPNVVPALTEFVRGSSWYGVLVVLATVLTLTPQLRRDARPSTSSGRAATDRRGSPERLALRPTVGTEPRGAPERLALHPTVGTERRGASETAALHETVVARGFQPSVSQRTLGRVLSIAYIAVWCSIGAFAVIDPPLATIANRPAAFFIGLVALVPPIWIAVIDHLVWPAPALQPTRLSRMFAVCVASAVACWACYAVAVPWRVTQNAGVDLSRAGLAVGAGSSLLVDLYVFTALFLALATLAAWASWSTARARVEYWLFVALLGFCAALVLYSLVCAAIAFVGREAAIASGALGVALAAIWADIARLRTARATEDADTDTLHLFAAPVAGVRARWLPVAALLMLPVAAYELVDSVSHLDWNFLLQKLTVLAVWLVVFALVAAVTASRGQAAASSAAAFDRRDLRFALTALVIFAMYHGLGWLEATAGAASPREILERYTPLDASFRLVRDARTKQSEETVEYYAFLKSHSLAPLQAIPRRDVDFVTPIAPAAGMRPDIYLIIVDSLRRDYVEPYNPRVTFTPEIARFARDSFVFDRAFTRYAGTTLAVASIWAGGLLPHALEFPSFGARNTLLKMLDGNGYTRFMDFDHVVSELVPRDDHVVELDRGKGTMEIDVCSTMTELEERVQSLDPARPAFFYSLPQSVHIAIGGYRKVPAGESYPGFFAPIASSVRRIDGCIGGFIEFLKRTHRYEKSIVILTSDHGDSLGEEGRWGHAYFIVPEVMRIPLIMHVPPALTAGKSVDLSSVMFSSDLSASLYTLLGYAPDTPGPFMGHSVFGPPNADAEWRRRDDFLVASSYGAVFGVLRQNGTRLYSVDAVDGQDDAFDLSDDGVGKRVAITPEMTFENRELIRGALLELARENHAPSRH